MTVFGKASQRFLARTAVWLPVMLGTVMHAQTAASPDGRVLFSGIDAKGDFNLWVTNGTSAGTSEISLAKQDPGGLNPQFLTVFGSK